MTPRRDRVVKVRHVRRPRMSKAQRRVLMADLNRRIDEHIARSGLRVSWGMPDLTRNPFLSLYESTSAAYRGTPE